MPPKRPSVLQPLQRRKQQPHLPLQQSSLRPEDRALFRPPLMAQQQRRFPVLHLRPEPRPVLVSLRPPALVPQRLSCLRP